ncbi:mercury resistance co-regulator MerD [Klebsiella pneumoniae]|nr:mercury resistance co-regulator MerD [Klebsiella pneumoniae]
MSAYTVSRLALDAGVSVHIVRDYLLRGLLRPVAYTTGGYGLFDDTALQRLRFVRAAFEAGIGLDALARLCRALDAADGDGASAQLAVLRQLVERRREALASLEMQLAAMPTERHCCKVSDEAAFCLIQRPYISKTLLTRRISPRGSP